MAEEATAADYGVLNPSPLPEGMEAKPPTDAADYQKRLGGWQAFMQRFKTDPQLQRAALMLGTNLLQPKGVGQSTAGHFGASLQASMAFLDQEKQRVKTEAAATRKEGREDKSLMLQGKGVELQERELGERAEDRKTGRKLEESKLNLEKEALASLDAYRKGMLAKDEKALAMGGNAEATVIEKYAQALLESRPDQFTTLPQARVYATEQIKLRKNSAKTKEDFIGLMTRGAAPALSLMDEEEASQFATNLGVVAEQLYKDVPSIGDAIPPTVTPAPGADAASPPPASPAPAAPAAAAPAAAPPVAPAAAAASAVPPFNPLEKNVPVGTKRMLGNLIYQKTEAGWVPVAS